MKVKKSGLFFIMIITLILFFPAEIKAEDWDLYIKHPEEIRIDQEFGVEISNLEPGQEYQLEILTFDNGGEKWFNQKNFEPESEIFIIAEDKMMELIQFMEPKNDDYGESFIPPVDFGESFKLIF